MNNQMLMHCMMWTGVSVMGVAFTAMAHLWIACVMFGVMAVLWTPSRIKLVERWNRESAERNVVERLNRQVAKNKGTDAE